MGNKIIIGMTGPFGSGCTYIAKSILEKMGYKYISLSDILRDEFKQGESPSRTELQDYGNKVRRDCGADFLAKKAYEKIEESTEEKWVIDSIRNTHEITYLREVIGTFYVIAVWADQEMRWGRVAEKYNRNRLTFEGVSYNGYFRFMEVLR